MQVNHLDVEAGASANGKAFEVEATVKSNVVVNGEYRKLVLAAPAKVLNCQPGQFFHLLCPVSAEHQPYLRRPMSIYGYYPEAGELHFLYKVAGEGTRAMAMLREGDTFNIMGPLGKGYVIGADWQNLLLVARGVGLATLAPLAQEARRLGRNLTAICSARSPDVLMSTELFRDMGAEVITVTDSEGTSGMDHIRAIIADRIAQNRVDALYTCGSNRMLTMLQGLGAEHGIPGQIALEQQMACGVGMCQCCVRSFRRGGKITHERVCREGPVFDLQEAMAW